MNYLYYYENYSNAINRTKIEKETACYFYAQNGSYKISKKTMIIRFSEWNLIHYYKETPELLEKWNQRCFVYEYKEAIEKLKKVLNDNSVMQKIIEISKDIKS